MITRTNLNNIQETGRLGNQMWVIASAIGIANKSNTEFHYLLWQYENYFPNIKQLRVEWINAHIWKIYKEPNSYYNDIRLDKNEYYDLKGYFQSYKYFQDCQDLIRYYLEPDYSNANEDTGDRVAIHVRRGDYLNLSNHPILERNYYERAMELFPNRNFSIFSDDIDFCRNSGWFDHNRCIYILPTSDILDFLYMSRHKDFIIANSSYSFWAAYLSKNIDKTIVAPKIWVLGEDRDDRVPPEWIRI
jgi:hypothetical protein